MKTGTASNTKEPRRPTQVAALVSEGLSPSQIAQRLGVTDNTLVQYIYRAVGEGSIRQCDVLFALDKKMRQHVELLLQANPTLEPKVLQHRLAPVLEAGCNLAEIELYMTYRKQQVYIGALYEFLVSIERVLHARIKEVLVKEFGEGDFKWWRQGVPEAVRIACSERWERDSNPAEHPYFYTYLIDLAQIIEKKWGLFLSALPKDLVASKPVLMQQLRRLNDIRNRIMHPVRSAPPTEEEFEFVREVHIQICPLT